MTMKVWPVSAVLRAVALILCFTTAHSALTACPISRSGDSYQGIDRYALSAPTSARSSRQALASYLTASAKTDEEKARAIFMWVAANVNDPDPRLDITQTDCLGHAKLFKELCVLAGLEAVVIGGHTRAIGSDGQPELDSHSWDAVKLGGSWKLVDTTWGSRKFDGKKLIREIEPYYFCVDPGRLKYTHIPDIAKWSLLDPAPSQSELEHLPYLGVAYFENGMKLTSPAQPQLTTDGHLEVGLTNPQGLKLYAELFKDGQRITEQHVFAQTEDGTFKVYCLLPEPGSYALHLMATTRYHLGNYTDYAVSYQVKATSGVGSEAAFPKTYEWFKKAGCTLRYPASLVIPAGTRLRFEVTVPGGRRVGVMSGGVLQPLPSLGGNRYGGYVTVSPGEVFITSQFPATGDFNNGLVSFQAR